MKRRWYKRYRSGTSFRGPEPKAVMMFPWQHWLWWKFVPVRQFLQRMWYGI